MKMKLKKGDEVLITTGKDRGKRGKIDAIFPSTQKVSLPGLNMYKRHQKRRDDKTPGGIIEFARPLPVSNVALICSKCKKQTRIGMRIDDKKRSRFCRKCEALI